MQKISICLWSLRWSIVYYKTSGMTNKKIFITNDKTQESRDGERKGNFINIYRNLICIIAPRS